MVPLIRALHTFWLLGAGTLLTAVDGDVRLDPRTPFYEIESRLPVGNKGEKLIDVSVRASCGEMAWVFDHAELIVRRNRFGNAQFVDLPARGCSDCAPIRLRWYHEPTGHLSIAVHVYRRLEVLQCPTSDRPEP